MEKKIADLFEEWQDLNDQVNKSFGNFDFDSIKKIRMQQKELEDSIYIILINSASEELKKILPDDCGEMEIGFNNENKRFYYVMYDPEDDAKLLAITIDINKKVGIIKNFEIPD